MKGSRLVRIIRTEPFSLQIFIREQLIKSRPKHEKVRKITKRRDTTRKKGQGTTRHAVHQTLKPRILVCQAEPISGGLWFVVYSCWLYLLTPAKVSFGQFGLNLNPTIWTWGRGCAQAHVTKYSFGLKSHTRIATVVHQTSSRSSILSAPLANRVGASVNPRSSFDAVPRKEFTHEDRCCLYIPCTFYSVP